MFALSENTLTFFAIIFKNLHAQQNILHIPRIISKIVSLHGNPYKERNIHI